MKKIVTLLTLSTLILSHQASAFVESPYIGLELGQAKLNLNTSDFTTFNGAILGPAITTTQSQNFGGRLFFGYQFARYAAAEIGISQYGQVHVRNVLGVPDADVKITANSLDAVAKIILPIDRFNLFAKLGFAGIHTKSSPNSTAKDIDTPLGKPDLSRSDVRAKPIYGLGAGADLNPNFTITVAWTRIASGSSKVDSASFTSIGFLYRFNFDV